MRPTRSRTVRFQVGEFVIVPQRRRVFREGHDVRLGGRAFDLMLALIEQRDQVVTKDALFAKVWPDVAIEPNNLAFQVWTLRQLFGPDAVRTVARRGYQWAAPVREVDDDGLPLPAPQPRSLLALDSAGLSTLGRWVLAQRLLTLVATDGTTRHQLARCASEQVGPLLRGGVWWLPRCPSATEVDHLVHRLGTASALLVLEDGHMHPRATLSHVTSALALSGRLHLLVTSLHALHHPLEQVVHADAALRLPAPLAADQPARLRWQSRS